MWVHENRVPLVNEINTKTNFVADAFELRNGLAVLVVDDKGLSKKALGKAGKKAAADLRQVATAFRGAHPDMKEKATAEGEGVEGLRFPEMAAVPWT